MDQFTLNLIVVGFTFAIYIGIAIWARAGTTAEFYAAGRGVPPVMNGMATGADWMSAASFISMAGIIAMAPGGGYSQSGFLMGWTGGYVLLALLLAPYLRKFGKFTVPEFIGDRFYSGGARLLAVVCLIVISVTYVIGQMRGVGVTFSRFLEVSTDTGLYIGAAIVFAYAVLGGMKGITYTQVAQYVVLIIAYTIPALFISLALTGNLLPQLGLIGGYAPQGGDVAFLAKLDQVVTELGFTAYTADVPNMFNMVLFTMSLMIGTAGLPHVIIRFFTVPKVADARSSAGWALVFIALLYTVAPAVGSMARLNLTTTMWPSAATGNALDGEAISRADIDSKPELAWVRSWEKTGLLEMKDLNGDGRIQYFNDAPMAAQVKAVNDATKALADARTAAGLEAAADLTAPEAIAVNGAPDANLQALQATLAEAIAARDAKRAEIMIGGQSLVDRGWVANEVTKIDNDIMVLANPEIAALPGWVVALVAAGAACGRPLDRCRSAAGHLLGHQPRPHQGLDQSEHLGKGRASGSAHRNGLRHRACNLPRSEPARLCRAGGGAGLRPGRRDDLPGTDDGHLLEAHQQGRGDHGDARGPGLHLGLHLPLPRLVLHPGHGDLRERSGELVVRHLAALHRDGRRGAELRRRLRRLGRDLGSAARSAGPGRVDPRAERRRSGTGPLTKRPRRGTLRRGHRRPRGLPEGVLDRSAGDRLMNQTLQPILDFLKAVHPYDSLPRNELVRVASSFVCMELPAHADIYRAGDPLKGLYLVQRGEVEILEPSGGLVSLLGPGNSFGERGLMRDGLAATTARTTEASVLLSLPTAEFRHLVASVPAFERFFGRTRSPEPDLATRKVADLMARNVLVIASDAPIATAARMMRDAQVSSLGVVDNDRFVGIVTTGDMTNKVVAGAMDAGLPVSLVMTPDPVSLAPSALGSDILHTMLERRIGHLPVIENGKLVGMVTQTDLTRFQAVSSASLVRDAAMAQTVDEMATVTARIPQLLVQLVGGHSAHEVITRLITDVADTVTRRLLALAEARFGPPPVPYLWLACGSQGRQEQTGVSDQDNCLFLDDAATPEDRAYFLELARFVCDGLNASGYVYCPGEMMAMTPKWCQPMRVWRDYFSGWISRPDPMAQMLSSVMFDLRPIGGTTALFNDFQAEMLDLAARNSIFVAHMIANSLKHQPPLGLLRGFATIRSGEFKNRIDLKHNGVVPVVDLGRLYALNGRLAQVNTRARLEGAEERGIISVSGARDLIDAYDMIARIRLEHQADEVRNGRKPDNFLAPSVLSDLEQSHLRDAFVVVRTMQSAVSHGRGAPT